MDFRFTDDERALAESVAALARRHFTADAYTWERREEYPWANLRILADNGLTGMLVDPVDGGQGASIVQTLIAQQEISRVCPHTGDAFHSANFRGVLHLSRMGSDHVKEKFLTPVIAGERLMALAMSEPDAGSATTEMRTHARVEGDELVINGTKVFNSDGPLASQWLVWLKFDDTEEFGTVVVERNAPGFSTGAVEKWLFGGTHTQLTFEECRVPIENVVFKSSRVTGMFDIHNVERLSNAVRGVAFSESALEMARHYAQDVRKQFGKRLTEFQGIQWKFATMLVKLEAARLLCYRAAANADLADGRTDRMESSIAKYFCGEVAFEIVNDAMQVFAGYGIDASSPISFLFKRTRALQIGGGTAEIQLNGIASAYLKKTAGTRA